MKADKAHEILPQTAVFLWIFLRICSVDKERMDDDFKPMLMIANLRYATTFLANTMLMHSRYIKTAPARPQSKKSCYRCTGIGHSLGVYHVCKECFHNCHKVGHIKKACKQGVTTRKVQYVDQIEPPTKNEYLLFKLTDVCLVSWLMCNLFLHTQV